MKREELLELLRKSKQNGYVLENKHDYDSLAKAMFEYIGDPDPELRDELIYVGYDTLLSEHRISKETMLELWMRCQDSEHLLFEQGSHSGDSVYVRSFCTLLLVCLLETHKKIPFLQKEQITEFVPFFCDCYEKEQNLRGYTKEKGWAHTVAHGADLLETLAGCEETTKQDLEVILQAIRSKVCQGDYVYIDDEPWRISQAVRAILNRTIFTEEEWMKWLDTLQNPITDKVSIECFHARINIQNFLRTLYFTVHKCGTNPQLLEAILIRIEK